MLLSVSLPVFKDYPLLPHLLHILQHQSMSPCKWVNALSRIHAPKELPSDPELILPLASIISPIQWALDAQIAEAMCSEPTPQVGP